MSFLSDLFSGDFGNLGTDITHAPESFVQDLPSEAPYLAGAAALGGGLLFAPEIAAGLGAADTAGALGTGAADLGAANTAFGAFDPAVFGANAADVAASGGLGADVTAADLAAAGIDPAVFGASDAGALSNAAPFLPGDPVSGVATDASQLSAFAADPTAIGAGGGGDLYGVPTDASGFLTQELGGQPAVTDATQGADIAQLTNATPGTNFATPAGTDAGYSQELSTLSGATPGTGAGDVAQAAKSGGLFGQGGFLGTGASNMQALTLGAAIAPLGLALARGEAQLPSSAVASQQNAAVLSQFGQANINGTLNAGQLASLQVMQQNLTNQWRQTLYNQGVQDITKDGRWPQIQAQIDQQVTAQTATMINQNITQALNALGAAGTQLNQIAQMQMQADSNFTNTLVNATKSLGLLAGSNFTGGTTKAAA